MFFKKKKALVFINFVLSSVLFAMTFVAFAWFANNEKTDIGGATAKVVSIQDVTARYFYYDTENKQVVQGNNLSISMANYDSIFTDYNEYLPVVIEIRISCTFFSAYDKVNIEIERQAHNDTQSQTLSDYTSSIVGFKLSSLFTPFNNISDCWTAVVDDVADDQINVFTTLSNNTYTKTSYIDLSINYSNQDITGDYLYVYLVADYNTTMAQLYAEQEDLIQQDENIRLTNDITYIKVSLGSQ